MQNQTAHRQTPALFVALPTGLIFVAAGLLKLFLPVFRPGAHFSDFLAQTITPFPQFFGIFVPLLEIGAGLGLFWGKTRRPSASSV